VPLGCQKERYIPTRVPLGCIIVYIYPPGCSRVCKRCIYPPGCLSGGERCIYPPGCLSGGGSRCIYPPGCLSGCGISVIPTRVPLGVWRIVLYTYHGAPRSVRTVFNLSFLLLGWELSLISPSCSRGWVTSLISPSCSRGWVVSVCNLSFLLPWVGTVLNSLLPAPVGGNSVDSLLPAPVGGNSVDSLPSCSRGWETGEKGRETRYREEVCTREDRTVHTRFTVGWWKVSHRRTPVSLLGVDTPAIAPGTSSSRTFLIFWNVRNVRHGNVENVQNCQHPRVYPVEEHLSAPQE